MLAQSRFHRLDRKQIFREGIDMPATIEPATTAPVIATCPRITFDVGSRTIILDVIVRRLLGTEGVTVLAAPVTVPPDDLMWTLVWNLVPGEGIASLKFREDEGIVIPSVEKPFVPAKVSAPKETSKRISDTQWEHGITHSVMSANCLAYDISFEAFYPGSPNEGVPVTHDPTIAVTPDPIG
jgi:hypothetical protein